MNKYLLLSCHLLFLISGYSQITFQKAYGDYWAENAECVYETETIKQTADNGYAVINSTQTLAGFSNSAVYFLKLNQNGDTIFTKVFYRPNGARGRSVFQTADGGYILGVEKISTNASLIKIDSIGNVMWSKDLLLSVGLHSGYCAILLKSGDFLVSGGGGYGASLFKIDGNGNSVFGKRYYTAPNKTIIFYSTIECSNGDLVSVGYYYDNYIYGLIMRTDANGNIKFAKKYNIVNNISELYKSVELPDKSIISCGYVEYANYNRDVLLIRTDSLGNTSYVKTIGDNYSQRTTNVIKDANNNLYIAGQTNSSFANDGSLVIKLDPAGNTLFSKIYLNGGMCEGITLTNDKGFAIEGVTEFFGAGKTDVYVFKADSNGNAGCNTVNYPMPITVNTTYTVSNLTLLVSANSTVQNITYTEFRGGIVTTKCQGITTGINENENENEISLYPNPSNGSFTLRTESSGYKTIFKLYNTLGQIVLEREIGLGENIVDIRHLSKGLYHYIVFEDGKQKSDGKLISQ